MDALSDIAESAQVKMECSELDEQATPVSITGADHWCMQCPRGAQKGSGLVRPFACAHYKHQPAETFYAAKVEGKSERRQRKAERRLSTEVGD